jgi:bacteriocin biosynthesis cyclodehydratase domain-containing protein
MTGVIGKVIGLLLQGPATYHELIAVPSGASPDDTVAFVDQLVERGFVTPDERHPVEQYVRYAFEGGASSAHSAVTLFGCGPLGSRIATSLLQHGLRQIRLVDDRPIDRLWHQFAISRGDTDDVPAATAAEALARLLRTGDTSCEVSRGQERADVVDEAVRRSDLVIVALEQVDLRLTHLVNRYALRRQTPWLHVLIDGNIGIIGPLCEPPYTACYNDFRTLATASTPSAAMMNRYRRHIRERSASSFFPGLPAYADIVAGYATLAAVHRLLGRPSFASGRVMFVDFEQMQIDVEDVLRLPRCPVCSEATPVPRPVVPMGTADPAS